MITLSARRISSFAMHKGGAKGLETSIFDATCTICCWCVWFWLSPPTKYPKYTCIPLRVVKEKTLVLLDENAAMLALLAYCPVPSFADIVGKWHGTWWGSTFCRVKMMSHVHINDACGCSCENNGILPNPSCFQHVNGWWIYEYILGRRL